MRKGARSGKKGRKIMQETVQDRVIFKSVNFGDLQNTHDQAKEKLERATELLRKAWDVYSESQRNYNAAREQFVSASRTLFSF